MSLLILERGMAGFERGRNLDKLGLHSQDTAELSFTDVRVPVENLLGEEGDGFAQLTQKLPQERMSIAISGVAEARAAFDETLRYVKDRKAFGTRSARSRTPSSCWPRWPPRSTSRRPTSTGASTGSTPASSTAADARRRSGGAPNCRAGSIDKCLQLHGGYGYMSEYPISRRYADARVTRIYGGTTEIMKSVVSKSLGL